jgi:hypothetical protein
VRCEKGVWDEVLLFDFGEGAEELGVVGFEEGFGQAGEVRDGRNGTVDLGRVENLQISLVTTAKKQTYPLFDAFPVTAHSAG